MGLKKVQKQGRMKHKTTILLQKSHGKERLEDYSTSVAQSRNRSRVVFQSFFTMTFLQQDIYASCVSISSLFLSFFQAHSYLHLFFTENFFTLGLCSFFGCLVANSQRCMVVPLLVILIIAQTINLKDCNVQCSQPPLFL